MPVRIRTAIPLLGAWFLLAVGSASPRAVIPEGIPSPSGLATVAQSSTGPEAAGTDWPMVAANPQRTSAVSEEVRGNVTAVWYRPIEPYINYKIQVIAAEGKLFVSTARGLYCLNAETGDVAVDLPDGSPARAFAHVRQRQGCTSAATTAPSTAWTRPPGTAVTDGFPMLRLPDSKPTLSS